MLNFLVRLFAMSNYSINTYCSDFARKQNTSATSSINFDVGFPAPCPAFVSIRAIKGLVYDTKNVVIWLSLMILALHIIKNGRYVLRLPGLSLVLTRVEVVQWTSKYDLVLPCHHDQPSSAVLLDTDQTWVLLHYVMEKNWWCSRNVVFHLDFRNPNTKHSQL